MSFAALVDASRGALFDSQTSSQTFQRVRRALLLSDLEIGGASNPDTINQQLEALENLWIAALYAGVFCHHSGTIPQFFYNLDAPHAVWNTKFTKRGKKLATTRKAATLLAIHATWSEPEFVAKLAALVPLVFLPKPIRTSISPMDSIKAGCIFHSQNIKEEYIDSAAAHLCV